MSLAAMVFAIHDSHAKGLAKFVQILIADYVDKDTGQAGPPGPSLETLAADGGIGKATVNRQLAKLTTLGELVVVRGGSGPGHSNVYIFPRFQDQQAYRSAPVRSSNRAANGPLRSDKRTANGPQTDRSGSAYMDDPDPDPKPSRRRAGRAANPNASAAALAHSGPVDHARNPGHSSDSADCPGCGTGSHAPRRRGGPARLTREQLHAAATPTVPLPSPPRLRALTAPGGASQDEQTRRAR